MHDILGIPAEIGQVVACAISGKTGVNPTVKVGRIIGFNNGPRGTRVKIQHFTRTLYRYSGEYVQVQLPVEE